MDRIRRAVREQRYRLSAHAIEEMADDGLESGDLESIVLRGQLRRRFLDDARGVRYEVCGRTADGRSGCIICRFLSAGTLLVITAYATDK